MKHHLIKAGIGLLLFSALSLPLCNFSVFAEDLNYYKKIIRRTCAYPQDEIYVLPVKLPVGKADANLNGEYLKVARTLETTNDVKVESNPSGTVITPIGNNYDVLLRTLDLSYKLESLGVVLGTYNFQALKVLEKNDEIIVSGKKIFTPSRLFANIIKVLTSVNSAKYKEHDVQWKIIKKGTKYSTSETVIK
ncbi:MAG: hypothetical protein HQK88_00860 [Nitrospirae bacterium]|nr:hypothetical protein [Nitrospirota bacterium]MBF0535106.1 hypothetical protein [Nitrospirota bacterium]MBF0615344.1 hypothetical protein [Nitrospirota bacterium]